MTYGVDVLSAINKAITHNEKYKDNLQDFGITIRIKMNYDFEHTVINNSSSVNIQDKKSITNMTTSGKQELVDLKRFLHTLLIIKTQKKQ